MEISFKSDGEVQIVEMAGVLGDAEAAAVRFKLEEKINGGKKKILLDLGRYETSNDAARTSLFGIMTYVLARQVLLVSCGLSSDQWPRMVLPDGRQIKNFLTRSEALSFARATAALDPRAHLKKATPTKDEEIKADALAKLLEKYEVFQHGVDLDPFRLEFLTEQYKNAPNREALVTESKVREAISQVQKENEALNQECEGLASRLKQMILYRKSPLGVKELALKEKSLAIEITEATEALAKIRKQSEEVVAEIAAAKTKLQENLTEMEKQTTELKNKLKNTQEQFSSEETSLKARDAQEQMDFEAKMKSKVKT